MLARTLFVIVPGAMALVMPLLFLSHLLGALTSVTR